ncbi:hypothetical protein AAFC00_005388 [Neodothiora populina]|uniref:Transcriptional regulatory protein RXT2 N-terminal domain-containing protein n=1 Tax=Neodothiora populina TaxID=2781224 RepID=A0ABR3PKS0_9PEZI
MASQQSIVFAETIRAMKLAMRRRDNDSDSDSSIKQPSNRGNKLKRNASHVREGRLDITGGRSYKRKINHAGYQRYIIQAKPVRYDEDGDMIDEEEEEGPPADGDQDPRHLSSTNDDDPWAETRLEELLAPLKSPADLAEHPSMSIPFTSNALAEMAENARTSLHREREILSKVKSLLLIFRGDDPWIPVEKLETDHDILLLDPHPTVASAAVAAGAHDTASTAPQSVGNDTDLSVNESAMSVDEHASLSANDNNAISNSAITAVKPQSTEDQASILDMDGVESTDMALVKSSSDQDQKEKGNNGTDHNASGSSGDTADAPSDQPSNEHPPHENGIAKATHGTSPTPTSADAASSADSPSNQTQHRMTTRARARTPTSPNRNDDQSPSPAPSSIPPIHGFFHLPSVALPDRDFGLPVDEAEETRRLLILFVQKQDQVVREAEYMLDRLLKADRMRKNVYRWAKAEGHVGEMSDGEDWYDISEWKLDTDLLKGKEEEEVEEEGRTKGRRRRYNHH